MKKNFIEGKNGTIELTEKYLIITVGYKKNFSRKTHLIGYEEIEDITYKKPTRDKYGHITLYLKTIDNKINEKIKYTIILDRINEKTTEDYKIIFDIINNIIIKNQRVIVDEEELEIEEKKDENEEETYSISKKTKKETKSEKEEEYGITEETTQKDNKSSTELQEEKKEEKPQEKKDKNLEEKKQSNKEKKQDKDEVTPSIKYTEQEKKNIETITILDKEILELEKKLKKIKYKEYILNQYIDETKELEEVEKLIDELKEIIKELERIKYELELQEKKTSKDKIVKLDNGNVIVTVFNDRLVDKDKKDLEEYIDKYKNIVKKIKEIEEETDEMTVAADDKKRELNISDEDYEKDVNKLYGVKDTKEFIEKYRLEAEEALRKVKREIEIEKEPFKKYRIVSRGISNQTRRLSTLAAVNTMLPGSRALGVALTIGTGLSAIRDMMSFDVREENHVEVIERERLVGYENIDITNAREMINKCKNEIQEILDDCEKKYSGYPKFSELKSELESVKIDIEKEDEELRKSEDRLESYKKDGKPKILRRYQN